VGAKPKELVSPAGSVRSSAPSPSPSLIFLDGVLRPHGLPRHKLDVPYARLLVEIFLS